MKALVVIVLFVLVVVDVIFLVKNRRIGRPDGILNVDTRDPDKDYYDFVFLTPTGDIPKKDFLTIQVSVNGEFSQGGFSEKSFEE